MKTLAFILFISLIRTTYTQTNNFAPIGARWHYNFYNNDCQTFPHCGYFVVESMQDTLVLGQTCRLLKESYFLPTYDVPDTSYIIYEDMGVIYLFRNAQFHKLYDFNAEPGDTINVLDETFTGYYNFEHMEFSEFTYVIDSVYVVTIDGQSLICQYVNTTNIADGWGFYNAPIYEKIGGLGSMLGYANIIPPEYGSFLRCYEDDELSYHNPSYLFECDFITHIANDFPDYLQVFPNPATDYLTIKNKSFVDGKIVIYNTLGSEVYSSEILANSNIEINISKYESHLLGVVYFSNGEKYSFDIIKF